MAILQTLTLASLPVPILGTREGRPQLVRMGGCARGYPPGETVGRYDDPRFRLAFARIVTHYWRHNCWMDGIDLIGGASKLADIPAILVHGRLDISGPPDVAWRLSQMWRGSKLMLLDDAGHGAGEPGMTEVLIGRPTHLLLAVQKPTDCGTAYHPVRPFVSLRSNAAQIAIAIFIPVTVPLPTPSALATFFIPSPLVSRARMTASTLAHILGRPRRTPWTSARSRPAFTRLRIITRLNSANAPVGWKNIRPAAMVVSMAC